METTRKITFSIQEDPEILQRVDRLVELEGDTRAGLYRRAMRYFLLSTVPTSGKVQEHEPADVPA